MKLFQGFTNKIKVENKDKIAKLYILNIMQVKNNFICYRLYPVESCCLEYNQILLRILEQILLNMNVVIHIIKRPVNNEIDADFLEDYNADANKKFKYIKNKNELCSVGTGVDKNLIGFMFKREIYNCDITIYGSDKERGLGEIKDSFVYKIVVEKNEDCLNIFAKNNEVGVAEIIKSSLKEFNKEVEVEEG